MSVFSLEDPVGMVKRFEVGDKVQVVQFTETYLDAPEETVGSIGTVDAIELGQGDYIYHVTFEDDPEGWNYKEDQLKLVEGNEL